MPAMVAIIIGFVGGMSAMCIIDLYERVIRMMKQ